jgi:transcriptional regulator GlxA family with amidase domain
VPLAGEPIYRQADGMRIEIVVFDGFDELDAIGPFEVFSSAGFDVELVGVDGPAQVQGNRGARLVVSTGLGQPDAVVVPGGGWLDNADQGARAEAWRGVLPARIAELTPSLRWIASVCTGGMLLAEAGILNGRTATTNRNAHDDLRGYEGVTVLPNRVVDDGNIVTAGGITSGFDLALHLVERELGAEKANRVAAALEYHRQTDIWQSSLAAS